MKNIGKTNVYVYYNFYLNSYVFCCRSGVKTECTCGFATTSHTPVKTVINSVSDLPKKPTKSNRKRRICETEEEEDIFPASYPDDDNFPFNEEIQTDVNYSFQRSEANPDHPEKNSMVRKDVSDSSETANEKLVEKKPITFNILDVFDESITFDLLCNETLNEEYDSKNCYV
jgi:hypothetical protein